jgi:hypothetical protein
VYNDFIKIIDLLNIFIRRSPMKRSILFLLVFLFVLSFSLSSISAQDTTTFPYLKPPNHLSPRYVIKLADGELIRSATLPLVGSIFGTDTYFKDLNDAAHRKELYKQVLREIVLMNVLEQDRKWLSYLNCATEKTQLSLDLLDPELMGGFFSLYRALIDNRYLLDNNVLTKSLNYLKQFGRMDTKITKSWWQTIEKLKLHQNTLDKVGKTLSFTSFISSIGSITLSAMEAMNQEIACQHLSLISQTLKDMEDQGEYFNPDFKQALTELTKENDDLINTSFISDFTKNFYYEWEKNKDQVAEKGLSLFMDTTGKKIITTTLKKAGLSNAALPALAWSLSIQYSYHVIQSGLKGIDLFNRYIITSDTLFWLRKMRDYAYANQQTSSYLSLNLLDATSQLYAYQLLESLMNTTPQKLMFWKLGARKLVLEEITSTQEELKSLFPEVAITPAPSEKPEMVTWEKTFGGSADDMANDIIQTTDGGYAVVSTTYSKGAGSNDAWFIKLDDKGNEVWDRAFGGSDWDGAYSLIQTKDDGYVIAAYTFSKGAGDGDLWLLKLNSQGNLLWDKTYGGRDDDRARSIIQTSDGGFALAGFNASQAYGAYDFWILRLDSYGNKIWEKTFGGSDIDKAYSLVQTDDGGFAVTGFTRSYGAGWADLWLLRLDSQGNLLWEKTYGGNKNDEAYSLIQAIDGGFVVAGSTFSKGSDENGLWVIKFDEQGNMVWDKTFDESKENDICDLIQNNDGGYTIISDTRSKGAGEEDFWILKLDGEGNKLWDKTYGGKNIDEACALIQTTDGGYTIAGYTASKGSGGADVWIIKLDEEGNLSDIKEEEPISKEAVTESESLTWERTLGGSGDDIAYSIIQSFDGYYIIAGETYSKGSDIADAWIIKLDSQGNIIWDKTYGGSGDDWVFSLTETADSGYAFAGGTESEVNGERDAWILKLDYQGNIIWDKTYGGSDSDRARALSIIQTLDGGYALTGCTVSNSTNEYHSWILKLDSDGNTVWDKTFYKKNKAPRIVSIIQTTDENYIACGRFLQKEEESKDYYLADDVAWVMKLDNEGNTLWEKTFGESAHSWAITIIQASEGEGCEVAGASLFKGAGRIDIWVIKLDNEGNVEWKKTFGGSGHDFPEAIIQTTDGDYAVAGHTESKGAGESDAWVIKLDNEGNMIWDKTFGGSRNEETYSIIQTTNGGFAIAGWTYSKGAGNKDIWILKLDSQGNLNESSEEESQMFIREEKSKEDDTSKATYTLRRGPAGGYIFYDKGSYSDGWRYLEVAPASTEWEDKEWGSYETWIGGTGTGIGTGKSNTAKIVKWLKSHGETNSAAQLCDVLVYGGYSDWFLPSKYELNLMYKNLKVNGVGDFADEYYWSSSESSANYAWYQNFLKGIQFDYRKNLKRRVRAVRAF